MHLPPKFEELRLLVLSNFGEGHSAGGSGVVLLKNSRPSGWRVHAGAAPPGGSLSSWGCGQRRGRPPPETGTTHWASGPRTAPPHSWHPTTTTAATTTSPRHLTDWNDSGSVLKFLGTHRRHGESGGPRPPRPHRRRAQSTSAAPTPPPAPRLWEAPGQWRPASPDAPLALARPAL